MSLDGSDFIGVRSIFVCAQALLPLHNVGRMIAFLKGFKEHQVTVEVISE